MAKLAFILIAHEPADIVGRSIDMLLESDTTCLVTIHYDRNSSPRAFAALKHRYDGHGRVLLVEDRVRCGWGQFGLVDGTVRALRLMATSEKSYTHAYLISCSCWPIRPITELKQFLDHNGTVDFIEDYDERWITGGLREERYTLHHPFGFARHRRLFEASVHLQRKLRIKRKVPAGLKPRYGSQWWCLRQETVALILKWIDQNPAAYRFYRHVWIPDETFFQTIVHALGGEISPEGYIPTLYTFNAHGKPIVFYDDHLAWLQKQPYFFARKVAQSAKMCRAVLKARACLPQAGNNPVIAVPKAGTMHLPGERDKPHYGQLFEPASGVRNWMTNIEVLRSLSVVLYGPPQLTRLAAQILGWRSDLTVVGRLFQPGSVDLPEGQTVLSGLKDEGATLRDYDRALYLSRVLARCPHLPVFELCPGDDPVLERLVLDGQGPFISLPLLVGGRLAAWSSLFWYLALPDSLRAEIDVLADRNARLQAAKEAADRNFGRKHVAATEKLLFGPAAQAAGIVFASKDKPLDRNWKAALDFLHGPRAAPLTDALDGLAERFGNGDWHQLAPALAERANQGAAVHG